MTQTAQAGMLLDDICVCVSVFVCEKLVCAWVFNWKIKITARTRNAHAHTQRIVGRRFYDTERSVVSRCFWGRTEMI